MKTLADILGRSRRIAFFGGAGVSTASGIPDFRGAGGLFEKEYEGLTPEMILSHSFFFLHPDVFFGFYRRYMLHPSARPNAAHLALARSERAGRLTGLVIEEKEFRLVSVKE